MNSFRIIAVLSLVAGCSDGEVLKCPAVVALDSGTSGCRPADGGGASVDSGCHSVAASDGGTCECRTSDAGGLSIDGGSCPVASDPFPGVDRVWSFGGAKTDNGLALAFDGEDSFIVAGSFQETADLDPGPGRDEHTAESVGGSGTFLVKLRADGSFSWARTFPGGATNQVAVATSGTDLFFAQGSGNDLSSRRASSLTHLSATGEPLWTVTYPEDRTQVFALAANGAGEVFVAGSYNYATVDLDPGPGVESHTTSGIAGFVSKFSSGGQHLWSRTFELGDFDPYKGAYALRLDREGRPVLAGGGRIVLEDVQASAPGVFVIKYDEQGTLLWVRLLAEGAFRPAASALDIDSANDIILVSNFQYGQVPQDFDPGEGIDLQPNETTAFGDFLGFISKISANGTYRWTRTIGMGVGVAAPSPRVFATALAVTPQDRIVVGGYFQGAVDFMPGPAVDFRVVLGNEYSADLYVAQFDGQGRYLWARSAGGVPRLSAIQVSALAVDHQGRASFTGVCPATLEWQDSISWFGDQNPPSISSAGWDDTLLLRFR
ncbi:MAG: hypothetical protein HY901_28885 [Deltaproteobacteria bacterium]|nr:hypothetical protein [Deltaproteobacteria bacterium]